MTDQNTAPQPAPTMEADVAAWALEVELEDELAHEPGDRALSRVQLIAWAKAEADGWRHVHPDELGHMTAAEARAYLRAEAGVPAETANEITAAEVLLIAPLGGPEETWAAGIVLGDAITPAEQAILSAPQEKIAS